MPELPEVEIIKRQLNKEIAGFTISNVWCDAPRMLKPSAGDFIEGIREKIIKQIERRAKLLVFRLKGVNGLKGRKDGGSFFLVHLKLSGRLLVRKPKGPPDDYVHVKLTLINNHQLELRFAEERKFGYMQYIKGKEELEKILSEFGPEPLSDLTKEKFREILQGTKRKIKEVLMDQEVISGIGNIYANEALWISKIHPGIKANKLSSYQAIKLFEAVESVLQEALKKGGASEQWYRQVHGEIGHYQDSFKVYQREGESCLRCRAPIKRIDVGGRGTFYCSQCQKVGNEL